MKRFVSPARRDRVSRREPDDGRRPGRGRRGPEDPRMRGPVPRLPDGTVDLIGTWTGGGPVQDMEKQGNFKPGEIPAAAVGEESSWTHGSPTTTRMPLHADGRAASGGWIPVALRAVPQLHIFVLWEGNIHSYRRSSWTAGSTRRPDLTWFGHSIGKWKATAGRRHRRLQRQFWFDRRGHPHTEQPHTIERWTRKDFGHLENQVTSTTRAPTRVPSRRRTWRRSSRAKS